MHYVIAKVWQRDSRNVENISEDLRSEHLRAIHPPETINLHMLHSQGKKAELVHVRFSFNAGSLTGWFQKHSWEVSVQISLTLICGSIKTPSLRPRFMKLDLQTLVWIVFACSSRMKVQSHYSNVSFWDCVWFVNNSFFSTQIFSMNWILCCISQNHHKQHFKFFRLNLNLQCNNVKCSVAM